MADPKQHFADQRVSVISPCRGDFETNMRYARAAFHDSVARGEHPFVPHLFYTQVLDDMDPEQRRRGMEMAKAWLQVSQVAAVYRDLGLSSGMRDEIEIAEKLGIPITYRSLPEWLGEDLAPPPDDLQ